jgi:hypothetical protein
MPGWLSAVRIKSATDERSVGRRHDPVSRQATSLTFAGFIAAKPMTSGAETAKGLTRCGKAGGIRFNEFNRIPSPILAVALH